MTFPHLLSRFMCSLQIWGGYGLTFSRKYFFCRVLCAISCESSVSCPHLEMQMAPDQLFTLISQIGVPILTFVFSIHTFVLLIWLFWSQFLIDGFPLHHLSPIQDTKHRSSFLVPKLLSRIFPFFFSRTEADL